MNSLLVLESRNPIYQVCYSGLKGDTYVWPRFESSGTWRISICAFNFKEPWLPQKKPPNKSSWCRGHQLKCGFTREAKRAISHPEENHLGRREWSRRCSTGTQPRPALRSRHSVCVALHLLGSHLKAGLLLQEICSPRSIFLSAWESVNPHSALSK